MKESSGTCLKGIPEYSDRLLVSMDVRGSSVSSIFGSPHTTVQDGIRVKAVAWYDSERRYSCRVCGMICMMEVGGLWQGFSSSETGVFRTSFLGAFSWMGRVVARTQEGWRGAGDRTLAVFRPKGC